MKILFIILVLSMTGCSSLITRGELNQCRTSCESLGMETAFDDDGNCSCKVIEDSLHQGAIEIKEEVQEKESFLELPTISKEEVIKDLQSQVDQLKNEIIELKKTPAEKESDELLNQVKGMFSEKKGCEMEKEVTEKKHSEKIIVEDLSLDPDLSVDEAISSPVD